MKKISTIFLRIAIVLIGIGALAFLLWEPHLEGRNVNATVFQIYFNDPFLAFAYIASIPFFVALYQGLNFLTQPSTKALRVMKYCAISMIGSAVAAEVYFFVAVRGQDDIAGGVAMGLMVMLVSAVVATAAAMGERRLETAVRQTQV